MNAELEAPYAAPMSELLGIEATGGREDWLIAADGGRLRYAYWPAADPAARNLVLLPGFTEFIEKYLDVVARLRQRGFAVWVLDWRGQGLSHRPIPDRQKPHVTDFALHTSDLDRLMQEQVLPGSGRPPVVLGHSMGGHIALRWLYRHAGQVERAVLIAPMLDLALGPLMRLVARILAWSAASVGLGAVYAPGARNYGPDRAVFAGNRLTSDPERFQIAHRWIARNPLLSTGGPTLGWLNAAFRSIDYLRADGVPEKIRTPILMVQAGRDTLVSLVAQVRLGQRLPNARIIGIEEAKHEVLKERDALQARFWTAFDEFTRER